MFWLNFIKVFIFLGPSEFSGSLTVGILRTVLRVIIVSLLALSTSSLLVISFSAFQPPSASKVVEEINSTMAMLNKPTEENISILEDVEVDTSKLVIAICSLNEKSDATCNNLNKENKKVELEKIYNYRVIFRCNNCNSGDNIGTQRLLTTSPLAIDGFHQWISNSLKLLTFGWPFVEIKFDSGPYVGAAMLIDATKHSGEGKSLSTQDIKTIRSVLDHAMEKLPSADKDNYIWPRRLQGWIQLSCYWLFSICIIDIILIWMTTVLPNFLLRREDSFLIRGNSYPAPWKYLQKASSPFFALLYEKIDNIAQNTTLLFGAKAVFPITDFRRTAYLAMMSSSSGSDVPTFISVESDSHRERLEATTKLVEYIIWAIPTLGFIGTVIGIGDALLATVKLDSGLIVTKAIAESQVGTRIGVAFDTTLVALVLSFILMLLFYILQSSHERMLAYEKREALSDLLNSRNIRRKKT